MPKAYSVKPQRTTGETGGLAGARQKDVQETARGKDRYSPKLLWKVADISRHDIVGLGFNRTFQNVIVVGISGGNDLKARIYQERCRAKRALVRRVICRQVRGHHHVRIQNCFKHSLRGAGGDIV